MLVFFVIVFAVEIARPVILVNIIFFFPLIFTHDNTAHLAVFFKKGVPSFTLSCGAPGLGFSAVLVSPGQVAPMCSSRVSLTCFSNFFLPLLNF